MLDKEFGVSQETELDDELTKEDLEYFGNNVSDSEETVDTSVVDEEDAKLEDEPDAATPEGDQSTDDKLARMSREQLEEAYKNLESDYGRKGQQLGELNKRLEELRRATPVPETTEQPPKHYTTADIPDMDNATLEMFIANYRAELAKPDLQILEPERHKALQEEYETLWEERTTRKAVARIKGESMRQEQDTLLAKFKRENNLSEADTTQLQNYARKLSDDGRITEVDLEVAYHKLHPEEYAKNLALKTVERYRKAKAQDQPRLPTGNSKQAPQTITTRKLEEMTDFERERYLENASAEEVERLLREINK